MDIAALALRVNLGSDPLSETPQVTEPDRAPVVIAGRVATVSLQLLHGDGLDVRPPDRPRLDVSREHAKDRQLGCRR
jgi:hypothetical protein